MVCKVSGLTWKFIEIKTGQTLALQKRQNCHCPTFATPPELASHSNYQLALQTRQGLYTNFPSILTYKPITAELQVGKPSW